MGRLAGRKLTALSIVFLVAPAVISCSSSAPAQTKQAAPPKAAPSREVYRVRQIPLNEKQILGVSAAEDALRQITDAAPEGIDKPSPETLEKLDSVARANGLASYEEYNIVIENLVLVCRGVDPVTKKYVGTDASIRAQIAQIKADRKIDAGDKELALANLKSELSMSWPAVKYRRNIELVAKDCKHATALELLD